MKISQEVTAQNFGEFFRQKRIFAGYTLRSFCTRFGFDPAYVSRIETNVLTPPQDRGKLSAFAKSLGIPEDSVEWVNFFDLSYLSQGKVPEDILSNNKAQKILPLLFRTARGQKLSKKKLQELVNLINNA